MPRSEEYRRRSEHYNAYQKLWVVKHKDKIRAQARQRHRRYREKALALYGGECACCHEATYEFLAIDHINGGGTKERKEKWPNAQSFYTWLKDNYVPEVYRVLCHNCNSAMGYYGYCPHNVSK